MKKKTINAVISKKIDEWVATIQDDKVKFLASQHTIVTGGCIASMLLKEPVNDFDVYFTNKETVKAIAEYYVKQFNDANDSEGYVLDGAIPNENNPEGKGGAAMNMTPDRIKIVFDSDGVGKEEGADVDDTDEKEAWLENPVDKDEDIKPKYRPIYISSNAITLSNKIQIVIRFYGEPDEIHQHYDYVHCTNYWLSKTRELTLKQPALEALLARELKYIGSKYPLASIIRTRKFIKRGWTINAGQYLKMCFQLSQLDLTDISVLEDQLTGVDVAYFQLLIDAITNHSKKEKEEGREFRLENSYLAAIIDKIF